MRVFVSTIAASLLVTAAYAQNMPAQQGPANPALKSMDKNVSSVPVAGANSFTMSQAKKRIEAKGYTKVAGLQKDGNGIWRGTATMNGNPVRVTVDYQGNVNSN